MVIEARGYLGRGGVFEFIVPLDLGFGCVLVVILFSGSDRCQEVMREEITKTNSMGVRLARSQQLRLLSHATIIWYCKLPEYKRIAK
jgi:hypothetical protein